MKETSITLIIICTIIGVTAAGINGCYQCEETKREAIRAGLVEIPTGKLWGKSE